MAATIHTMHVSAPAEQTRGVASMAKALVKLPVGVVLPGIQPLMECEGTTVAEVLADCIAQEPRLKNRIFRQDGTPWVGIVLNGRNVTIETALTAVKDGDEIRMLPLAGVC
jgi:molybdopterin converting factor small subunit